MEIIDCVYGKEIIIEDILIDLINSKMVQRLKGINQLGLPPEWHYGVKFTRYEHSIGTLILLRRFCVNLNEQIAGLLHDVSHAAFSHTYDYFLENEAEDHGDNIFFDFLKKDKEIVDIFNKHNIDINKFKNFELFALLDKEKPKLCADRIDYTLREWYHFKDQKEARDLFSKLIVKNNNFYFKDKMSAKRFAEIYHLFSTTHWGGPEHITKYCIFADALKQAVKIDLICLDDFWKNDKFILDKLKVSNDKIIQDKLTQLKTKKFDIRNYKCKFRYVDPEYIDEHNNCVVLTTADKEYKEIIEKRLKENR